MTSETTQSAAKVTIRLAQRADAATIHALVVELARSRSAVAKVESSIADIERDGFGEAPAFEVLLAEVEGRVVGLSLFFGSYSTWRGRRGVYLQDLVVADTARGLGIGQHLLAATAALCRARGGAYLRLSVDDDNLRAQAFYRRGGLAHSKSEMIQVIDGAGFIDLAESAEEIAL